MNNVVGNGMVRRALYTYSERTPLPRSVIWHGMAGPTRYFVRAPSCPPAGCHQSEPGLGKAPEQGLQAFQIRRYVAQMRTGRMEMEPTKAFYTENASRSCVNAHTHTHTLMQGRAR